MKLAGDDVVERWEEGALLGVSRAGAAEVPCAPQWLPSMVRAAEWGEAREPEWRPACMAVVRISSAQP